MNTDDTRFPLLPAQIEERLTTIEKRLRALRRDRANARRGFASYPPEIREHWARLGGQTAQRLGRGHQWTSEEAARAGRKGGQTRARKHRQEERTAPPEEA